MGFLTTKQLSEIGFKKLGKKVLISEKASIYNPQNISIGDNCRIDDFVILSAGAGIEIGNWVHIGPYSSLTGKSKITMEDFSGLSTRVTVFSSSGDFGGDILAAPVIASETVPIVCGEVYIEEYVLVGAGAIVLPNVRMKKGSVAGCLSLVKRDLEPFKIYAGSPAKYIRDRPMNLPEIKNKS